VKKARKISFVKMSGSGNDFVVFDNRTKKIGENVGEFVRHVCTRKVGVGADGVLLIERDRDSDFFMRYINADGSEAEMCGNGGRCAALFALAKGIAGRKMRFRSDDGMHEAAVLGDSVRLRMREPVQVDLEVPLILSGRELSASFVNTGVPHVVILVEDVEKIDVLELGREIRHLPRFQPQGTNADFAQARGDESIQVRTYERGVECETLACGTGCVAAALVTALKRGFTSPIACLTAGGEVLKVWFERKGDTLSRIFLEGSAVFVYEGKLPAPDSSSGGSG
jgi:diaminopimelate epimerase